MSLCSICAVFVSLFQRWSHSPQFFYQLWFDCSFAGSALLSAWKPCKSLCQIQIRFFAASILVSGQNVCSSCVGRNFHLEPGIGTEHWKLDAEFLVTEFILEHCQFHCDADWQGVNAGWNHWLCQVSATSSKGEDKLMLISSSTFKRCACMSLCVFQERLTSNDLKDWSILLLWLATSSEVCKQDVFEVLVSVFGRGMI